MNEETRDLIDALKMKIEALQIRNEALKMRVETLEMQFGTFQSQNRASAVPVPSRETPASVAENDDEAGMEDDRPGGKKRGRKPKPSNNEAKIMEAPLNARLQEILKSDNFNRATFRSLTGVLLCLYVNGTATVNDIYQWIGGSRVTIVRHTGQLKKMGLLIYAGSRKKGHYELTEAGKNVLSEVRQSIEA
jgi:hypothetical protein